MNVNVYQCLFFWRIVMKTELIPIKSNEIFSAFLMLKKGFLPTFFKYFDTKISPVFKTYSRFLSKVKSENTISFWIIYNGIRVGELFLLFKEDMIHISDLFVLEKYQNKGIAQNVINTVHSMYSDYKCWHLFTIKQEKGNCHLYEKLGYTQTGVERKINKRMTLIEYERRIN